MLALRLAVLLMALGYALVNAIGAWAVIRRKGWMALVFMAAAATLVVAGVAVAYHAPLAAWLLLVGCLGASLASLLNARIVIGRVDWRPHLIRALVGAVVAVLAFLVA